MEEGLSEYLVDEEFLQFIKAMKVYYWTQDLYDLHVLKKKCSDKLKTKLKFLTKVNLTSLISISSFFNSCKDVIPLFLIPHGTM